MLPFGKLIDELNVERVPGYAPLYQAVFNFENASLIDSANPRAEGELMAKSDIPFVHSNKRSLGPNPCRSPMLKPFSMMPKCVSGTDFGRLLEPDV